MAFGCFSVELPEGWGQLKSAAPDQVVLAAAPLEKELQPVGDGLVASARYGCTD